MFWYLDAYYLSLERAERIKDDYEKMIPIKEFQIEKYKFPN